jgi:hypothetical protein
VITNLEALQQQMTDDLQWAMEAPELQTKYAGQLIVVHKKRVLAAGLDEASLLEEASSSQHPREELVIVEMLAPGFEICPDIIVDAEAQ